MSYVAQAVGPLEGAAPGGGFSAAIPAGPAPAFMPYVPRRRRADGWSSYFQRLFISELARHGSVAAAARGCGRSVQSAYRLRDREGTESFAAAWARAAQLGIARSRARLADRYVDGEVVLLFRRGKQVGTRRIYRDRVLASVITSRAREREQASALERRRAALEAREAALARREAQVEARAAVVAVLGVADHPVRLPGSCSAPLQPQRQEDSAPPTACGAQGAPEERLTSHLHHPKRVFLAEMRQFPPAVCEPQDMVAAIALAALHPEPAGAGLPRAGIRPSPSTIKD